MCSHLCFTAVNFSAPAPLPVFTKKLRQWGRRLLQWPSGAPGSAMLGELAWAPFRHEVVENQCSLFGRSSSADPSLSLRFSPARLGLKRSLITCETLASMRCMCGEGLLAAAGALCLPGDVAACALLWIGMLLLPAVLKTQLCRRFVFSIYVIPG